MHLNTMTGIVLWVHYDIYGKFDTINTVLPSSRTLLHYIGQTTKEEARRQQHSLAIVNAPYTSYVQYNKPALPSY